MDVEILSRLQFAFTIAFHYIYPPFSIGLGLNLVVISALWLKTRKPVYHNMARFWTRIFGLTFAVGVATGIVMEFEFGTNWATYSRFVGDVFGSALAIEGLYAFFLESGFLAILLFGWDKVGPKTHFFATCMVCLGAHFSAIWILVANSWMQTPAGFHLARRVKVAEDGTVFPFDKTLPNGSYEIQEVPLASDYILQANDLGNVRAVIDDFWAMALNPSTLDRITHTVLGCWLAGTFLIVSISAYYLLRNRNVEFAKTTLKVSLSIALVAILLQMWSADSTARGVANNQPVKLAAIEGLAESQTEAPLGLGGIVFWDRNEAGDIIGIKEYAIKIKGLLSILVSGDFFNPVKASETVVRGLEQLPTDAFLLKRHPGKTKEELATIRPEYWPNVPVVFQTYHIMIACGMALLGISILAFILMKTGYLWKLKSKPIRLFLWVLVISVFIPQIANQMGWYTAEMGRQPWVVYNILKTSEGLSNAVSANQVLSSLILFAMIYTLLFASFIFLLHHKIKHGPRKDESIEILPERWRPITLKKGHQTQI